MRLGGDAAGADIALTVQASGQAASTLAATNITSALPNGEPTVQLGDNLFVALLTAKPPASAPFKPGALYFYELTFTPQGGGTSITFASAMSAPGTTAPDLSSIVHTESSSNVKFPSFSLPPQTLSQVRSAHASCRKAGALRLLDKVIAAETTGATDSHFALYLLQAADVRPDATVLAANAANVIPFADGKNCSGALPDRLTDPLIDPAPKQLPGWGTQRSYLLLSVWTMYDGLGLPELRTHRSRVRSISWCAGPGTMSMSW